MRLARPLLPIAVTLCALALPGAAQAQSAQPRIIAGADTSSLAHPYQARLSIRSGSTIYQCGGVIRDATHVMTAAHCLVEAGQVASPSSVTVHYGNANRSLQFSSSVYSVTPAPEYVAGDGSYDAALLTLSTPLLGYGGPTVQPIPLASASQVAAAVGSGANAVVSGWGVTEQGSTSQNLRATTVTLRPDSVCRSVYGSRTFVSSRFVCAGGGGAQGSTANPDSCNGDSGGPLAISTGSGYALVGLVSFGPDAGCGRGGVPGAYTEVSEPGLYALLTGQTAPAPPSVPAPATVPQARRDATPPRAGVAALRCRKRVCTVRVRASDNRGVVRSVNARTTKRVKVCVTRRSGRRSCRTARRTRNLRLAKVAGGYRGRFRLSPGSYRFSVSVADASGNRSRTVTRAFRVRR